MSNNDHPITPPPELVQQWTELPLSQEEQLVVAAQWGADQELEACREHVSLWFVTPEYRVAELRAARRPKPPSLKAQAIAVLDDCSGRIDAAHENTIRRALEQLDD